MQELREAIRTFGRGLGQNVVKVDMFLNHRIDTGLLFKMGKAFAEEFACERPTMILTVEASGIALAVAAAHELGDLPVVFAKKGESVVQSEDVAQAPVYSFTHKKENVIRVEKRYIPVGARVLIIDDFLANGCALQGLIQIVQSAGATVEGIGIAIEKGFQSGGRIIRNLGFQLESLAIVESMDAETGNVVFREQ